MAAALTVGTIDCCTDVDRSGVVADINNRPSGDRLLLYVVADSRRRNDNCCLAVDTIVDVADNIDYNPTWFHRVSAAVKTVVGDHDCNDNRYCNSIAVVVGGSNNRWRRMYFQSPDGNKRKC